MTYAFKTSQTVPTFDKLIATALNGVVYTENGRLHIKGNKMHYIYKPNATPTGWYARNIKTLDDIFLGVGASPTIDLENIQVEDVLTWNEILRPEEEENDNLN